MNRVHVRWFLKDAYICICIQYIVQLSARICVSKEGLAYWPTCINYILLNQNHNNFTRQLYTGLKLKAELNCFDFFFRYRFNLILVEEESGTIFCCYCYYCCDLNLVFTLRNGIHILYSTSGLFSIHILKQFAIIWGL